MSVATAPEAYTAEIDGWHKARVERLKGPDGWLSLVGLHWLKEGDNRVGADEASEVVLPKERSAPFVGMLKVRQNHVELVAAKGSGFSVEGKAVERLLLKTDAAEAPTILALGTLRMFVLERGGKLAVRVRDTESPARQSFTGIERYPVSAAWRVQARFVPYEPPKTVDVPTVLGTVEPSQAPGALEFEKDGVTYRLDAIAERGSSELFIIFADPTNGKETYGSGRFVYAPYPKDGVTVLDFNKAYNPPCAFTPYATCPLPPPQNRLRLAVTAGEKNYGHH